MDMKQAMHERHMVRKYLDKPIPVGVVEKLEERVQKNNEAYGLSIKLMRIIIPDHGRWGDPIAISLNEADWHGVTASQILDAVVEVHVVHKVALGLDDVLCVARKQEPFLIDYLRKRFDRRAIILVGQSWGTVLATDYIHRHPRKIAAYIGVGQVTDFLSGKMCSSSV